MAGRTGKCCRISLLFCIAGVRDKDRRHCCHNHYFSTRFELALNATGTTPPSSTYTWPHPATRPSSSFPACTPAVRMISEFCITHIKEGRNQNQAGILIHSRLKRIYLSTRTYLKTHMLVTHLPNRYRAL